MHISSGTWPQFNGVGCNFRYKVCTCTVARAGDSGVIWPGKRTIACSSRFKNKLIRLLLLSFAKSVVEDLATDVAIRLLMTAILLPLILIKNAPITRVYPGCT